MKRATDGTAETQGQAPSDDLGGRRRVVEHPSAHSGRTGSAQLDRPRSHRPSMPSLWIVPSRPRIRPSIYKGYDTPTGHTAVAQAHYVPHIRRIGQEKLDERNRKRLPSRRWVMERTLNWMSKCLAILIRYARNHATTWAWSNCAAVCSGIAVSIA